MSGLVDSRSRAIYSDREQNYDIRRPSRPTIISRLLLRTKREPTDRRCDRTVITSAELSSRPVERETVGRARVIRTCEISSIELNYERASFPHPRVRIRVIARDDVSAPVVVIW